MSDHVVPGRAWWWLSFAKADGSFNGACIIDVPNYRVPTDGLRHALAESVFRRCNPGGEVLAAYMGPDPDKYFPPGVDWRAYAGRLLTREDMAVLGQNLIIEVTREDSPSDLPN